MSGSLNKVILIGNLGQDPEMKMTPGGQPLARFSLATTETWKDGQGNKKDKTEWHRIIVWGKQAEVAERYLRKGKQVMVEGRIQYTEYTDQAGAKRTSTEIRCDNFVMLGSKPEGAGGEGASRHEGPGDPMPSGPGTNGSGADDIPF